MSESNTVQTEPSAPKHLLRKNLLGRPREGMEPAKSIVERHRSAS
jgi:hypothetical protein